MPPLSLERDPLLLLLLAKVVVTKNKSHHFYAPEGTSDGILKSHRPSVSPSVTNRVSAISHKLLKQI